MGDGSEDWLRQAEADLEHAELSLQEGDYEWSCFAAQQSAEKGVKVLYYHLHGDPWGHSLLALLEQLPQGVKTSLTAELLDSARALDRNDIQTRYPNGFSLGAPTGYFTKKDAVEPISHAKSVLAFCRGQIR